VTVIPFAAPSPSDPTSQRYIQQAQGELSDVSNHVATLQGQISDLQTKLASAQQQQAELNRLLTDLQNP
jgi:peptidoglycan hydrolase CwlO-like protein